MTYDILIRGMCYIDGYIIPQSIIINNERIVDIKNITYSVNADRVIDFSQNPSIIVFAGFIDIHAHLRDLKLSYKEDFYTGTRAAAKGGITIVGDMPNTRPETTSLNLLDEKDEIASSKALIDYGLYVGLPQESMKFIKELPSMSLKTIGVKIYMYKDFYGKNIDVFRKILEKIAEYDLPTVVHAENPRFFRNGLRPIESEVSAIKDIFNLKKNIDFKLHITHLSSKKGLNLIRKLRRRKIFTIDTCPHYLIPLMEKNIVPKTLLKVHPPLRSKDDCKALLNALRYNIVDAISSDHAPHTSNEKMREWRDAPPGIPGIETMVPILFTLYNRGVLSLYNIASLLSENPAKILSIPKAGLIKEGFYANLTIVNLKREKIIDPSNFESKAKYSPFVGMKVRGIPIMTIVRGKIIMEDEVIVGERGFGRNVKSYYNHQLS